MIGVLDIFLSANDIHHDYLCGKNEVIGFPHPHMSNGLDVPIKKYFYEGSLRS